MLANKQGQKQIISLKVRLLPLMTAIDRSSPTTERTTVAGLAFNFPEQRKQWQHQVAP